MAQGTDFTADGKQGGAAEADGLALCPREAPASVFCVLSPESTEASDLQESREMVYKTRTSAGSKKEFFSC